MERTRRPQAATPAWNKLELVSQRRPAMHTIPVHGSSIGLVGVPHGLMPHMAEPAKLEEEIKTNEVLAKIFENRGDYEESVRLAKQHSGKIATMREVIKLAKSNPELLGMLEGEKIYVSDVPAKASGHYRINYRSGRLEAVNEAEWHKLPFKERALVRQGDHHTLVDFRS
ncbi:MAG: hypothetical protein KGH64_05685, partial [Candidatus Micrarchaeota archaeon]|nr:hypothetical protein [Candidatus Micrarchaeota archaeon]